MRPFRPEFALLALGVGLAALALLFPPWRGVAVTTTVRRPVLEEADWRLMRLGIAPESGSVHVDTTSWNIPFASILDPPGIDDPMEDETFKRTFEAIERDSALGKDERLDKLTAAAESYAKREAGRARRSRVPERFSRGELFEDTIGTRVYRASRLHRLEFTIAHERLALTVAAIGAASLAAFAAVRAWSRSG